MRRTPRSGRSLTAALAVAVLLALSSCGGGDDPEATSTSPTSASSDPSDSSSASSSEAPAEGEDVDPAEFVAFMKSGLEASTTAKMSMTVDAAGSGIKAKGQADYTTRPPSMAMTMTSAMMSNQPIDLRLVDGVMYLNLGKMSQGKFVKFDLSDKSSLPPGMSDLTDQMDPLASFEQFEPALKSVTFAGDDDVDGEQLAHYLITLDPTKMQSMQGIPSSAGMPDEIEADLWFDDQFRVRQMNMDLAATQPVKIETRLYDWDEPVEIEAPPANQVVDPSTAAG